MNRFLMIGAFALTVAMSATLSAQESYKAYEYQEVMDPALNTSMMSMKAHQLQYQMFLFYTINVDTPGFVETGGYNIRLKDSGEIKMLPYYRWRAGPISETNNDLDFYLDANSRGFFVVQLPNTVAFTRDGRFRIDTSGRLVTLQGSYPIINDYNGGAIVIPQGADVTVSRSGVIYADADPVGKIKVAVFTNLGLDKLVTLNGSYFVSNDGEFPEEIANKELGYGIHQGFLEENNVLKAIVGDVGQLKRAYESTAKAAKIVSRVMSSAVQMAHP